MRDSNHDIPKTVEISSERYCKERLEGREYDDDWGTYEERYEGGVFSYLEKFKEAT